MIPRGRNFIVQATGLTWSHIFRKNPQK